jgi:hypothetical protein
MIQTPLDQAHLAAEVDPEQRLRFYDRLVGAELFLLLDGETPKVFDLSDGPLVLAFDLEERVAEFAPDGAARAEMTGRTLIAMLAGQGVGLGLNLSVGPSSQILPPNVIDWLAQQLQQSPAETFGVPTSVRAPGQAPEALIRAVDEKLAGAAGLATSAYLVGVDWRDAPSGLLLAFLGAPEGAKPALSRAIGEAWAFCGTDAPGLDVSFLDAGDAMIAQFQRFGLRYDIPQVGPQQIAPGTDPARPPRLR